MDSYGLCGVAQIAVAQNQGAKHEEFFELGEGFMPQDSLRDHLLDDAFQDVCDAGFSS